VRVLVLLPLHASIFVVVKHCFNFWVYFPALRTQATSQSIFWLLSLPVNHNLETLEPKPELDWCVDCPIVVIVGYGVGYRYWSWTVGYRSAGVTVCRIDTFGVRLEQRGQAHMQKVTLPCLALPFLDRRVYLRHLLVQLKYSERGQGKIYSILLTLCATN
jgi:hypothetical protein